MCNYHVKLIDHMVKATPKTIVGLILVSTMFVFAFWNFVPITILVLWTFLQAVFIFIRFVNYKKLKLYLTLGDEKKLRKHLFLLMLAIIYSAILWNFAFLSAFYYSPKNYEFVVFSMSMGILTAGVISLSSIYRIFVLYFVLMLTPMSLVLFYLGGYSHYTVLLFLPIYIPTILLLARSVHDSIIESSNTNDLLALKIDELHKLSVTDSLTNIHNRRYFFETASNLIKISQREKINLSLLMLDIDHFKKINDKYGHQTGDMVLVEFTKEINSMIRTSDIFARVGGEEFTLLLYKTSMQDAKIIAQKICKAIEEKKFISNNALIDVTVSIGVSTINNEINTLELLYKDADSKLYEAKSQGRNQIV